eukprot:UN17866
MEIENVGCWKCGCVMEKKTTPDIFEPIIESSMFYLIANETTTDKLWAHNYHKIYGKYLREHYNKNDGTFLEIGLGCNMAYGPGHSTKIWVQLFKNVEFIENDEECVEKYRDIIDQSG